ncbi:MAG: CoA pyrophosphatase [Chitinophagales bacterium]|nr:CoA pyrophosphatase [Bacteroidota bacterium]MCB9042317.1 CoA pyrophosphatase [Chitinophagales bacterium]
MDFNKFIVQLSSLLQADLPGQVAQAQMSPLGRSGNYDKTTLQKARKSAVCLLLYPHENDIFFPLIERPTYDGTHSGQMAFPGGAFEADKDQNLTETALRETFEEIGISPDDVQVLGNLSGLYIMPSNFWVQPVLAYLPSAPSFIPDKNEVASVVSIPLQELLNEENVQQTSLKVRGILLPNVPYFALQDKVVWGATAAILAELKALLQKIAPQVL